MIEIRGYRVLRQIGAGGMGLVYEAEQLNPRRLVALKVLRADSFSPNLAKRLEYEAQVLGQLKHPGIAQIYEAGSFDPGDGSRQPFIAMELVRGEPLTLYSNARHLSTEQKLALLAAVSDAVEHAHRKGIIHRDLKPENILIEENGRPKILDFGLARVFDGELKALTTCRELGEVFGTILYMSPEQTHGRSDLIDLRSDIYSLGVVGFELLTGEFPHPHGDGSSFDYLTSLREDEPRRASSFNHLLIGDIETILSKALIREKRDRYQSTADFAADIRRFLGHEPILARPVSTWYQLRKFSRRNRTLVAGVCATFLALFAGLIGTFYQARIAAIRTRQAESRQYLSSIRLASMADKEYRRLEVESALREAPAAYRRWEWDFLSWKNHGEIAILRGHAGQIRDVVYSPDGSRLLSVGDDATARLWDPVAARGVAILRGHSKRILTGRFSPDGELIATASDDNTARLWTADGSPTHALAAHTGPVNLALFSPDGRRVATASDDRTARIWDANSGECVATLIGHDAAVGDIAWDPSGGWVATAGDDDTARIWDGGAGRCVAILRGHADQVNVVRFSPNGASLLTASEDTTARIWDLSALRSSIVSSEQAIPFIEIMTDMGPLRWAEFTPDGAAVVLASRLGFAGLWDGRTGAVVSKRYKYSGELDGFRLNHRGDLCILASKDDTAVLLDMQDFLQDGRIKQQVFRGHSEFVTTAAFHPDRRTFVTGSKDGTLRLWPVNSDEKWRLRIRLPGGCIAANFTADERLFTVRTGNRCFLVEPTDPTKELQVGVMGARYACGDVNPQASMCVTLEEDGTTTFWSLPDAVARHSVPAESGEFVSAAFSPDGKLVVCAGPGNDASIWSAADGAVLRRLTGHRGSVIKAAFDPTGARILTVSRDGTVGQWSAATGKLLTTFRCESDPASACFSPDSTRIAVSRNDHLVDVWDCSTGLRVLSFPTSHLGAGPALTYTPDGERILTASADERLAVWDAGSGEGIISQALDKYQVLDLRFSPNGRFLAVRSMDSFCILDRGPARSGSGVRAYE